MLAATGFVLNVLDEDSTLLLNLSFEMTLYVYVVFGVKSNSNCACGIVGNKSSLTLIFELPCTLYSTRLVDSLVVDQTISAVVDRTADASRSLISGADVILSTEKVTGTSVVIFSPVAISAHLT